MKKITFAVALIAFGAAVYSVIESQKTSELVYVDVNKLLEGYKKTAVVRAEFQKKSDVIKANVDSLLVSWQQELQAYEKERSKMTKKELELKQELLANKQEQISNYQEAIQQQLKEEDRKTTQTVINDINGYIEEYGKKHNYKIIFGASGSGNLMYAHESTDLTQEVLDGLNEEYGE